MTSRSANPADLVIRSRLREQIQFPDLTERLALKLSSIPHYTARAHFGAWHRRLGSPDWTQPKGIFTPLVYVEIEASDLPLDPRVPIRVRGETFLARTLDESGETHRLMREGRYTLLEASGRLVARARLLNMFTRYDPDPVRRRVTSLPPALGLGTTPSRVTELPQLESMVPSGRRPDFVARDPHVWHYGQTDANRHVNSIEYLRVAETFVADLLHDAGHDLARLFFVRARMIYRKPCFRGEAYRRVAWFQGEAPPVITAAVLKVGDGEGARPAVAVELTLGQHEA